MQTLKARSCLFAALCLFAVAQARCENLNEILNQISTDLETKKASTNAPAATQKQPAQTESRKPAESKRQSPKPKPKETIVEPMQPPVPDAPRIVVYRASDKLPKDFRGQGLAGRFLITATDNEGHPLLISAEDSINPFARQFWGEIFISVKLLKLCRAG